MSFFPKADIFVFPFEYDETMIIISYFCNDSSQNTGRGKSSITRIIARTHKNDGTEFVVVINLLSSLLLNKHSANFGRKKPRLQISVGTENERRTTPFFEREDANVKMKFRDFNCCQITKIVKTVRIYTSFLSEPQGQLQ